MPLPSASVVYIHRKKLAILECFHALDKLSSFVRVSFSNSTSSHEVLHRSHNILSVLSWRGVALNDAGEPVSNDKNLLNRVIAQLGRLASVHEVKGDEVAAGRRTS